MIQLQRAFDPYDIQTYDASNLEKYDYTVMCKNGWVIEANAIMTTIKHDGIVQMTIEKNQEW